MTISLNVASWTLSGLWSRVVHFMDFHRGRQKNLQPGLFSDRFALQCTGTQCHYYFYLVTKSMSLLLLLVLLLNPHYYYSKTALLYSFTEHCTGTQCHYYYYYFYCYYYIHTYHRSYDYSQTALLFNLTEQHNTPHFQLFGLKAHVAHADRL